MQFHVFFQKVEFRSINSAVELLNCCLLFVSQVEPYLMRSNKRGVEFEGYIADLVHQIARVLSVDYEWRVQRRVGRRRKDGSWTGMIGELLEGVRNLCFVH